MPVEITHGQDVIRVYSSIKFRHSNEESSDWLLDPWIDGIEQDHLGDLSIEEINQSNLDSIDWC